MDAPRREHERPVRDRSRLRCRVRYATWNIRREDGSPVQRSRLQRACNFVDCGGRQHALRWVGARRPRGEFCLERRCGHPRSRAASVRVVEVHGRRRELHPAERQRCLPEPDARGQRRNHPSELRLDARRQPRRARPEHLNHHLCSYGSYWVSTNGRGVLYSTDAGASFTDMTWDATTKPTPAGSCCQPNAIAPNGMHPDQHALVVSPTDPGLFFEGSDGGLMRSSGSFADISPQCTSRGLSGSNLTLCQRLLSRVPTYLYSLNKGLSTLQFQSLSVAPDNYKHLQGGTQDNGTFETYGSAVTWPQIIYGDGGQSGFSANNSYLRFNSFTGQANDANFQNGDPTKWVIISAPIISSPEGSQFYAPIVADPNPANAGTIFQGSNSVWRTQDWGGSQAYLEANCPEFTTPATQAGCGDFVQIGPVGATRLTTSASDYRGTSRSGGNVAAIARTPSDTGTLWAATTAGRVFISKNEDAPAGSVTYTRLDSLDANSPGRFVSGIYIDPTDANHAWISYSSYSSLTPSTPGHVFSVTYNPAGPSATWTNLDGSGATAFPDFPATGIVRDSNGDLYVSNDWGVLRLPNGSTSWAVAGTGLPMVEVAGLTIVPGARKLYAATHGRSAWQLTLP